MSVVHEYQRFINGAVFSGELRKDVQAFLEYYNEHETFDHTINVETKRPNRSIIGRQCGICFASGAAP